MTEEGEFRKHTCRMRIMHDGNRGVQEDNKKKVDGPVSNPRLISDPGPLVPLFGPALWPFCEPGGFVIALAFDVSVNNPVPVEVAQRLENLTGNDSNALFVDPW